MRLLVPLLISHGGGRLILTSKQTPLGLTRLEPEAAAKVFILVASDAAAMVSGAAYDVTGGDGAHNV